MFSQMADTMSMVAHCFSETFVRWANISSLKEINTPFWLTFDQPYQKYKLTCSCWPSLSTLHTIGPMLTDGTNWQCSNLFVHWLCCWASRCLLSWWVWGFMGSSAGSSFFSRASSVPVYFVEILHCCSFQVGHSHKGTFSHLNTPKTYWPPGLANLSSFFGQIRPNAIDLHFI